MSLIGRVDQKNAEERERVVRFLIDAGWYREAREELDRLIQDFPRTELSERAASARVFITQAEADAAPLRAGPAAQGAAIPGGGPAAEDVPGQGHRHRAPGGRPRDRAARPAAAGRGQGPGGRPAPAGRPADARGARPLAEGDGRDPQGHRRGARRGPRPVRRLAEGEGRPEGDRRGAVRPGDVGLRRRPRHGRARPEGGRGALAGPRRRPRLPHSAPSRRSAAARRPGSRA